MAVRLERAHTQRLGQGEGLAVVADGGLDLWGRLARRALAQEPQGPGLLAALLVLAGKVEGLRGALARLFQATSQQIRFAEVGDGERQTPRSASGDHLLHPLLHQRQTRGDTPIQGIRQAQGSRPAWARRAEVPVLAQTHGPL